MSKIKTREKATGKDIKVLDKSAVVGQCITVHIRHLREKLGDTIDNPKYIKTIWGVGYKIET